MWGRPRRIIRATTRQVEPEWDDLGRERAEGLALHDQQLCPGCGLHPVILEDPERNVFTFEDKLCKVCAGQTQYGRMLAKGDADWDEAHKDALPQQKRPGDGRHVLMRRLSPEEIASRRDSRRPRARGVAPEKPQG